jgi:hypothetical protein
LPQKKFTAEMIGDALRESGTLIIVFGPLYELFEPSKPSWYIFLGVMLVGIVFLFSGIEVERRRA